MYQARKVPGFGDSQSDAWKVDVHDTRILDDTGGPGAKEVRFSSHNEAKPGQQRYFWNTGICFCLLRLIDSI